MIVRFWGTRGSIAKPNRAMLGHGGNTSCVEVRTSDGTLIVLDCGTGAHDLGHQLAREGCPGGHLLIGHTHWDHIQGFPFFEPLFVRNSEWHVYAPGGTSRDLEKSLSGQMAYEYSPITIDALSANVHFHSLTEGTLQVGGVRVTTQYMNHPVLALAYRLEADGATLVYAADHEPHSLHPLDAPPGTAPVHHEDRRHVRFLEGADLVIHDAQYTLAEFPEKAGWGHSPVERAVDYALLAEVPRLVFTHHDPGRDDAALDEICRQARSRVESVGQDLQVEAAAEGDVFDLASDRPASSSAHGPGPNALLGAEPRRASTVLIVDDDPDMVALLEETLREEGVRVLTACDGKAALDLARKDRPTLILLDLSMPGFGGLDVCAAIRAEDDPRLRDAPIVILTGKRLEEQDLVEAFVAGATDYLTKPVKPTLVRSRVRGWLLRTAAA